MAMLTTHPIGVFGAIALLLFSAAPLWEPVRASQTCVDQPPLHVCIDDPESSSVNAGTMTANGGSASASAEGGLAASVLAPARFVATYSVSHGAIPVGATYSATLYLEVFDGHWGYSSASHVALSDGSQTSFSDAGELSVDAGPSEPTIGTGWVRLRIQTSIVDGNGYTLLADAQSVAPVRFVLTPPRETVATTDIRTSSVVEIGTASASDQGATATAVSDATIIPADTAVVFRVSGTFNRPADAGPYSYFTSSGFVWATVQIEGGALYQAGQQVLADNCFDFSTQQCSVPGAVRQVQLEVLVPGSALHPRDVVRVNVEANIQLQAVNYQTNQVAFYYHDAGASGRDVVYMVG